MKNDKNVCACVCVQTMGVTQTAEKIISKIIIEGYSYQVSKPVLDRAIMEVKDCIDDRTVKKWRNALVTFGYLLSISPTVFQLVPSKISDFESLVQSEDSACTRTHTHKSESESE